MMTGFISVLPPVHARTRLQNGLRSSCPLRQCNIRRGRGRIISMETENRSSGNEVPPTSKRTPTLNVAAWFRKTMSKQKSLKASVLRNYGIAAFISYGFFDALTYSISFVISLQTYIAAGKVLTWNTLPQVLALMWGINNFSRPFRIAGAFALAPVVDRRVVKPFQRFITRFRKRSSPSED